MTKNMKKLFTIGMILCILSGCVFMTGKDTGKKDKDGNPIHEQSTMVTLTAAIAGIIGVGSIAVPAARIAQNAARARDALYDSNKEAIENTDWSKIDSAESFKAVMKLKQDSHDDSVLLRKEYLKWKTKKKKKALKRS